MQIARKENSKLREEKSSQDNDWIIVFIIVTFFFGEPEVSGIFDFATGEM